MNANQHPDDRPIQTEEFAPKKTAGMPILILNILLSIVAILFVIFGAVWLETGPQALGIILLIVGVLYICAPAWILGMGLRVIKPNEAMVLTLFGRYIGTLRGEGFYFVNPFSTPVGTPVQGAASSTSVVVEMGTSQAGSSGGEKNARIVRPGRKISLKAMTLSNEKQKINDALGNPIIIGIVVIWRVTNTVKAVFNVDNYTEFLSIQCDSALRNIVRVYPYDACDSEDANEKSLRGSSQEIAAKLRDEIAQKVEIAGLEIMEARITHLAYAPEIAAAMLQRQQAAAIVDARQLIVEGAVGMVEMALARLNEREVVQLDEERKAAMVSNLMVVLCGNKDAQPIVNSGTLY